MLITYQRRHYENSANGITNRSIKVASLLASVMFVNLVISRENTPVDPEENKTVLPLPFFIICCCWVPFSSGWIIWNAEARTFTYRRICELLRWSPNTKTNTTESGRYIKGASNNTCQNCNVGNFCPNCIAKAAIQRQTSAMTTTTDTDPVTYELPGSVHI